MNILFLFSYLPSLDSDEGLYVQLINEFKRQGHNVYVSAKGQGVSKSSLVKENGVDVLRIKSHDFTGVSNKIKKALAYQEYVIKQRFYVKKVFRDLKIDLIISHSLPPEIAYVIGSLKLFYKCKFYLIQSDYTWQDAVGFGYFSENSLVARYYKFWEKRLIQISDFIGCPTIGNINFIKRFYPFVNDDKFSLLPFWMNELNVIPNYELRQEFGVNNKFIVVYGGSIGIAQRVDHVIELADLCKEINDIVFVIIGKGPMLPKIKELACIKRLDNVIFNEYIHHSEYLSFLATCDVGLIMLNEKTSIPNFPSKSLSYLNMRVPILAAVDYVTDFGSFLEENSAGLWAYSDKVNDIKQKLLEYYNNKQLRKQVSENGYKLFKSKLTTDRAYLEIYNKVI